MGNNIKQCPVCKSNDVFLIDNNDVLFRAKNIEPEKGELYGCNNTKYRFHKDNKNITFRYTGTN